MLLFLVERWLLYLYIYIPGRKKGKRKRHLPSESVLFIRKLFYRSGYLSKAQLTLAIPLPATLASLMLRIRCWSSITSAPGRPRPSSTAFARRLSAQDSCHLMLLASEPNCSVADKGSPGHVAPWESGFESFQLLPWEDRTRHWGNYKNVQRVIRDTIWPHVMNISYSWTTYILCLSL